MIIAVAGVAGTLGGALLTQRGSERAKRLEIELVRDHEEVREARSLRRTCYVELNRDARQFTTALNRHLHRGQWNYRSKWGQIAVLQGRESHQHAVSTCFGSSARSCSGPSGGSQEAWSGR